MMGFTKEYGKKQRGMMNHYGTRRGLCASMLNFNAFLEKESDGTRGGKEEENEKRGKERSKGKSKQIQKGRQ
jgi:hypothetical protein